MILMPWANQDIIFYCYSRTFSFLIDLEHQIFEQIAYNWWNTLLTRFTGLYLCGSEQPSRVRDAFRNIDPCPGTCSACVYEFYIPATVERRVERSRLLLRNPELCSHTDTQLMIAWRVHQFPTGFCSRRTYLKWQRNHASKTKDVTLSSAQRTFFFKKGADWTWKMKDSHWRRVLLIFFWLWRTVAGLAIVNHTTSDQLVVVTDPLDGFHDNRLDASSADHPASINNNRTNKLRVDRKNDEILDDLCRRSHGNLVFYQHQPTQHHLDQGQDVNLLPMIQIIHESFDASFGLVPFVNYKGIDLKDVPYTFNIQGIIFSRMNNKEIAI